MTSSVDLWGEPEPSRVPADYDPGIEIPADLKVFPDEVEAPLDFVPKFIDDAAIGHRMSLLPISQYCGKAGDLSEQYGAGRAAAMSSAFHAGAAGLPIAKELLMRLSPTEREEVASWKMPATLIIAPGVGLDYSAAMKEFEVELEVDGVVYSKGHPDMAWISSVYVGETFMKVCFIGDFKKSIWTTEDGPDSLQLHAYGMATAKKFGCDAYCAGIWSATDGEWLWSRDWVILDSDHGRKILERLIDAATHRGQAYTGGHCRGCYARMHCPEHLLPVALSQSFLAPIAEGGDLSTVDHTTVLKIQALEELCDRAKKQIQAGVERGDIQVTDPESGKRYLPVMMPGRFSVKKGKELAQKLGDDASEYVSQGNPYAQFRWTGKRTP